MSSLAILAASVTLRKTDRQTDRQTPPKPLPGDYRTVTSSYRCRRRQLRGYSVQRRLCVCLFVGLSVCLSVCLFSTRYLKNQCSSDHQIWHRHDPPWKLIYFGVSKLKVKVTRHKNIACVGHDAPASAGVFCLIFIRLLKEVHTVTNASSKTFRPMDRAGP